MTNLSREKLLSMASKPINHKPHYAQYCDLLQEGLIKWTLGFAHLTEAGKVELDKLKEENDK